MTDADSLVFVDYDDSFLAGCLELFDQNCPGYFAPNEKADYQAYLSSRPACYKLCLSEERLMAAFGVEIEEGGRRGRITWIMVSPASSGRGVGARMMQFAQQIATRWNLDIIDIAASHLSEPFFSKFGAVRVGFQKEGWGEGMHRVDMEWPLSISNR
jgi:GNAT superfamily N-acetyltransferase